MEKVAAASAPSSDGGKSSSSASSSSSSLAAAAAAAVAVSSPSVVAERYPPHLKKVLKTYQKSAVKSLQGPNTVLVEDGVPSTPIKKEPSPELLLDSPPRSTLGPQVPILSAPDQSAELSETLIEGHKISCFIIGGEKRICFVQLLSTVLRNVNAATINNVCAELFINFSSCNSEQLLALKAKGLLPPETPTCGLVTKPDAERLCSVLLHEGALPPFNMEKYSNFSFLVYHECFSGAKGVIYVDLYTEKNWCIQCVICRRFFTPQMFVCHSCYLDKKRNTIHTYIETGICHWGFDSTNWRIYLRVLEEQPDYDKYTKIMDVFKDQHKGSAAIMLPVKRKQTADHHHKNSNNLGSNNNNNNNNSSNNNNNNHLKTNLTSPGADEVANAVDEEEKYLAKKKAKMMLEENDSLVSAPSEPAAAAAAGYYGSFHSYYNLCESWVRTAAAGYHAPWPPYPISPYSKDSKSQGGYYFADGVPPPFLAQGPPVLLHPERVVSISQSEQFERSYQPNVSLAPSQSKLTSEPSHIRVKKSVICIKNEEGIKSPHEPYSSESLVDVEEHRTSSPVSSPNQNSQLTYSAPTSPSTDPVIPDNNGINGVVEQVAAVLDALSDAEDAVRQRVINLVERLTTRIDKNEIERLRFREEISELRNQLAELRQENMQLFYDNNQLRQQLDKANNQSVSSRMSTPRPQHCSPVSVITSPTPSSSIRAESVAS